MKVKTYGKKMLRILLSVLVILSVFGLSAFAAEDDCAHTRLSENNWDVVRAATCSTSGLKTQRCPDCLEIVEFIIPIEDGAHVWGPWELIIANSCYQEGREERKCTECNITLAFRTIPAHNYKVLYGKKVTCMRPGYEFVMCTTCYDMKTVEYEIDPNAHAFGEWQITTEATCVNDSGVRTKYCNNVDADGNVCTATMTENYTDADNHVNIEWYEDQAVPATCEREGYVPGVCLDCREELRKPIARHSQITDPYVISTTPSTCYTHGVERRRCACGLEYDYELPLADFNDEDSHVYSDWIISKQPSCTAGERFKYCLYHQDQKIVEEIPANGEHNYGEWEVTVEPDCTKTGVRVKTCADCGDEIVEELPTAHVYATWTTVSENTQLSCKEGYAQDLVKLAKCNNCNFEKYFTVPGIHDFSEWIVRVPAYCSTGNVGLKERTCFGCGKVESMEYTEEHSFTDWVITDMPACATDSETGRTGEYTRWCTVCKKAETKRIPAAHEFTDWEIIDYPKCNADGTVDSGLRKGYCKFCGAEKIEETETEHIFGEWTIDAEADCLTEGQRSHSCKLCGYTESEDYEGAHSYTSWSKADESVTGCSTTWKRTCNKCNATERKNAAHPNLRTATVEASCSTSGYKSDSCPDCGYSKVYDIVPAKGHSLEKEWHDMVPATCTEPGSRYKACSVCDYLEFEYIKNKEHTLYELEPGIAATCTTEGKTPKSYCIECKEVFESFATPANGHDFDPESGLCKVCKVYNGSDNCTCSCHSTNAMEKLIFSIINKLYQLIGINQNCKCGALHYDEVGFLAKLFGKG